MKRRLYWLCLLGGTLVILSLRPFAALLPPLYLESLILIYIYMVIVSIYAVGLVFIVILRIADIGRGYWPALLIFVPFGLLILGLIPTSRKTISGEPNA